MNGAFIRKLHSKTKVGKCCTLTHGLEGESLGTYPGRSAVPLQKAAGSELCHGGEGANRGGRREEKKALDGGSKAFSHT